MSSIEIRAFERRDREQLTELVNAHVDVVVPGLGGPLRLAAVTAPCARLSARTAESSSA